MTFPLTHDMGGIESTIAAGIDSLAGWHSARIGARTRKKAQMKGQVCIESQSVARDGGRNLDFLED